MATVFLSWIMSFLLGLSFPTFAADPPKMTEVEFKKLAGKWYPVKTVTSELGPTHSYAFTLEPAAHDTISMQMEIPKNGKCTLERITLTTIRPGILSSSEGRMVIKDVDYKSYFFGEFSRGSSRSLHLCARKKTVSMSIKQKFKSFVKSVGFKQKHNFKLRKEDMCKTPPVNA